ncbi:MAG: hypothetical protein ACI9EF_003714 [Pseudohongiellaceae bacterium]|jgi:hypothetical protein
MRTLYVRPDLASLLPSHCAVMGVSPLLRELVLEVVRRGFLDEIVCEQARLGAVILDQLRETGATFGRWRQRARLLEALRRLASGEPVITTAIAVGYDSPSAFIAMFKRTLGKTPSRYFADPPATS